MIIDELLRELGAKDIQLRRNGDELVVRADQKLLDAPLVGAMRAHKAALLELVDSDGDPWWSAPVTIRPEMLTLVQLTEDEIARVVATVPGGARNVADIYPLAPLQEGIFFHHLAAKEGDPYLFALLFSFDSRENVDTYIHGLRTVIARHDILRTAVVWEGLPEPVQVVWRRADLPVDEVDLDPAAGDVADQLYARFDPRRFRIPVDQAPLLRVAVAHDAASGRWVMMQLFHHIAADHSSFELILKEIHLHLAGEADRLPPPMPFRNLVAEARLGTKVEEHRVFFQEMLGDVEEPTTPFGLLDVRSTGHRVSESRVAPDAAFGLRLKAVARTFGVTPATLCHLAFSRVLARVCGRDDVVFGTVLFGRMQGGAGSDRTLGLFMNTLPIRVRLGDERIDESVRRVHGLLSELLRHEHASLALAQRCSRVAAPAPLFSAVLNYRPGPTWDKPRSPSPALSATSVKVLRGEERTNYPLLLSIDTIGDRFAYTVQAHAPVNPARVCRYMQTAMDDLVRLLESAPDTPVARLRILPDEERDEILHTWNATGADGARVQCIHEMVEAQAEQTPDAVAVVGGERSLRYGELNRQANRLAHALRDLGVRPDQRVGICLERGVDMVVAVLAVLKAGGAYVPLDPSYPDARLAYMLRDSAPVAVVTAGAAAERVRRTGDGPRIVDLGDRDGAAWMRLPDRNLDAATTGVSPRHLAYVIYTSGSTGMPKGVAIEHANAVNFLEWARGAFTPAQLAQTLFSTSLNFDLAVFECLAPLVCGGTVRVVRDALAAHGAEVTLINTVPSAMAALVEAGQVGPAVRVVNLAGEPLTRTLVARIFETTGAEVVCNLYGPTETTTYSTWVAMPRGDVADVHIGRPTGHTQVYVLDRRMQPVPVGVAGELYIGGRGVARGYLNRSELTAARFVPDPFGGGAGARLYRTGDLVRWRDEGALEYLGRNDFQVKIRGFRIELGEIEARLLDQAAVRDAVVLARAIDGRDPRLVAYYTARDMISGDTLRRALAATLPEHMVPGAYVQLDALPRTPNGKVDRAALPAPEDAASAAREYEAPIGDVETTLAAIWSDVLRVARVGRHDNFFALGGHSLLAVRVLTRARHALGVALEIGDLFARPVLADLARGLVDAAPSNLPPIGPAVRGEDVPLSLTQQRLWFLAQMEGVSETYHISLGLRLHGPLNRDALIAALDRIVSRHEGLRTTFVSHDGAAAQRIAPAQESRFALVEHAWNGERADASALDQVVAEESRTPFDLARGPLVRGRLIREAAERHVLLVTMHHIVSDGWSTGIFLRELSTLYGAFVRGEADPLPALPLQYADYAIWQRRWLESDGAKAHTAYWTEQLSGLPILNVPVDKPRPPVPTFRGAVESSFCSADTTWRINTFARQHHLTVFTLMLAAFQILLSRIADQDDVAIGTGVANRHHKDVEGVIGFFTNTVVLRTNLSGNPSLAEVVQRAQACALAAYAHEAVPFDVLVAALESTRDQSRSPLFQVAIVLKNAPSSRFTLHDLTTTIVQTDVQSSKFDLTLFVSESPDRLGFEIEYSTDLFVAGTIRDWLRQLHAVVGDIIERPAQRLLDDPGLAHKVGRALELAPREIATVLPLSPTQRDLFLDALIRTDSRTYSLAVSVDLGSSIDASIWESAVRAALAGDPIARTRFCQIGNRHLQVVTTDSDIWFSHVELTSAEPASAQVERFVQDRCKQAYDLTSPALLRNYLLSTSSGESFAVVAMPHLLLDAGSATILLERIGETYRAMRARTERHEPRTKAFADYVNDREIAFDTPAVRRFWTDRFQRVSALQPNGARRDGRAVSKRIAIPADQVARLQQYCADREHSLPRLVRALYGYLIDVYFGSSDAFVIHEVAGGRPDGFAATLGCFYQIVPVVFQRAWFDRQRGVASLLERLRQDRRDLEPFKNLSVMVKQTLLGHEPLRMVYNFYDFSATHLLDRETSVTVHDSFPDEEVHLIVREVHGRLELALHFNDGHFSDHRFLDRMAAVLRQIAAGVDSLAELESALPDERARILEWGRRAEAYPEGPIVHELFEDQAGRTPEAVALIAGEHAVTYGELNGRANQLAHHLRALGVGPEQRVAICLERGVEMVVAIVAVLKAGGAYVPLDPLYPEERLTYMLRDSAPVALVAAGESCARLHGIRPEMAIVDVDDAEWTHRPADRLDRAAIGLRPSNLAYVIYTSGSTGVPKGVLIEHRQVARLFQATAGSFQFDAGDVWTLFHSYAFDFSVWELWGALLTGGRLIVVSWELARSPDAFYRLLCESCVTVLNQTPSAFRQLIAAQGNSADAHRLRYVIFGGERLDVGALMPWYDRDANRQTALVNMYGITETTVHVTHQPLDAGDLDAHRDSPIGRALADLRGYILTPDGAVTGIGLRGELCVGGAGVGRGYLNRPDLTAERFVPDPFATAPGARMYRSGDVGVWQEDGTIGFIGRDDAQVKIRGFRIELREIEARLRELPDVQDAVVIVREDQAGDPRLVAYYTAARTSGAEPDVVGPEALRAGLQRTLPEYMVPAAYVQMAALPLTRNGKLDYAKLPEPVADAYGVHGFEAPVGDVETALAAIWSDVLNVGPVGRHDNFFELGGHSLLATRVISMVRDTFQIEVPLRVMFEYPTTADMARAIEAMAATEQVDVAAIARLMNEVFSLPPQEVTARLDESQV